MRRHRLLFPTHAGFWFIALFLLACQPERAVDDRGVHLSYRSAYYHWDATAQIDDFQWEPGQNQRIPVHMEIKTPLWKDEAIRNGWKGELYLVAWGERLYDEQGRYTQQSNISMSGFLTPGGQPIETCSYGGSVAALEGYYGSPIEGLERIPVPLPPASRKTLDLDTVLELKVSPECPPGFYRIHLRLMTSLLPSEDIHQNVPYGAGSGAFASFFMFGPLADEAVNFALPSSFLPPVQVGRPAPPT